MKHIFKYLLFFMVGCFVVSSCEDMTMPEKITIQDVENRIEKTPEYYANLRAYKKAEHQLAFGWFGFWNGGTTSGRGALAAAPDSMDIISIWGPTKYNLSDRQKEDLRYVQEVLGTKVIFTLFSHNLVNLGFPPDVLENTAENIPYVARALADSIHKYGYDGIDFDHECSGNDLFYNSTNMTTLLRCMREYLGPDKLIIVDGHISYITEEGWKYADYAVSQAYGTQNPSKLQGRWDSVKKRIRPQQLIVAENFEAYWETGGTNYVDQYGNNMSSLEGMARWQPEDANGPKGGVGVFHMEYEYAHNPDYKFMRQAIQIMNPAVKP